MFSDGQQRFIASVSSGGVRGPFLLLLGELNMECVRFAIYIDPVIWFSTGETPIQPLIFTPRFEKETGEPSH